MTTANRLRWKCRRGTLELDLVLDRFMQNHYPKLSATQRQAFERLLDSGDHDLWTWLNDEASCDDAAFAPLVAMLRQC